MDYMEERFPQEIRGTDGLNVNGAVNHIRSQASRSLGSNGGTAMPMRENGFVAYLNSLHSLTAGCANALAESQALSQYFGELYEPFPLVKKLIALLADGKERVVILTGHAGDGKSTVALDVLKVLRGIPVAAPLDVPLKERELIVTPHGTVMIVKDMSELSLEARQENLKEAFEQDGSWLIVSNTGPLLHGLKAYKSSLGSLGDFESRLLERLGELASEDTLDAHFFNDFHKPLLILNLTRVDNVELGARILTKLVQHPGWGQCSGCPIKDACPLALNRQALLDAGSVPEERVRWIYRRIGDYEQRLTLRQIVAHLAYGLTGGLGCADARARVEGSSAVGAERATDALQDVLFSEGFFGYCRGKPRPELESLQAIALVRRSLIGGPVGADFERDLAGKAGGGWAVLPSALDHLGALWQKRAEEAEAVPARASLRRMALIFGSPLPDKADRAAVFLDAMLRSPGLRELDAWQRSGDFTLSRAELKRLRTGCLNVLLETYSGFVAGQFDDRHDQLYLTLRRPDRAVVQPTQLVIASLSFRDFELTFDPLVRRPKLVYRKASIVLWLPLPLLDYILRRDLGELGNGLSPILQAQLDRFHAALLVVAREQQVTSQGEISFLRAGVAGQVDVYRYYLDETRKELVKE